MFGFMHHFPRLLSVTIAAALLANVDGAAAQPAVTSALRRAAGALHAGQRPDGSWLGPVESDSRAASIYLLTLRGLGRSEPQREAALIRHLVSRQSKDGSFPMTPGHSGDVAVTRLTSLALCQSAAPQAQEACARSEAWLDALPPGEVAPFTKLYQAVVDQRPFSDLPYVSPRLIQVPKWVRPNLYSFSSMRLMVVAMSVLQTSPSGHPQAAAPSDIPNDWKSGAEWANKGWKDGLFELLTRLSRLADRLLPPQQARKKAAAWLAARQDPDGTFQATLQATSLAVLALHRADPARYSAAVEAGLASMQRMQRPDGQGGLQQQIATPTIWDTAAVASALEAAGTPNDDPRLLAARSFLEARQGASLGDWSVRVRGVEPGGWGVDGPDSWYPNVFDSVHVLKWLHHDGDPEVLRKGYAWILAMQNRDGGWPSWDRNLPKWLKVPSMGAWQLMDPSTGDLTGATLRALGPVIRSEVPGTQGLIRPAKRAARRAIRYLRRRRRESAWGGVWFSNYFYGTFEVVQGLQEVGVSNQDPLVAEALDWLESAMNEDGGFGELPNPQANGPFLPAPSNASHTAMAVATLIDGGRGDGPVAQRAIAWLVATQGPDGTWEDPGHHGVLLPGLWYVRYPLMPTYLATEALAAYLKDR